MRALFGIARRLQLRDESTPILVRVDERGASARTYRDEGTVRTTYTKTDGTVREHVARFRTLWSSPDRMKEMLDEMWAPFDVEHDIVIRPVFDAPIDPSAFDFHRETPLRE